MGVTKLGYGFSLIVSEVKADLSFSGRDCRVELLGGIIAVLSVVLKSSEEDLKWSEAVEASKAGEPGLLVFSYFSEDVGVALSLSGIVNAGAGELGLLVFSCFSEEVGVVLSLSGTVNAGESERLRLLVVS